MRKEDIKNTLAITLDQISKHSKREILLSDDDIDIMADRVLLLSPNGEKLERLREYCEKEYPMPTMFNPQFNEGLHHGRNIAKEFILSILNEKEEVFDVRDYLKAKGFNENCENEFSKKFKDYGVTFKFKNNELMILKNGYRYYFGTYKHFTKYFFEQLLKSLGIDV